MQTSCAPSPSTRKRAAEGQLDLCLPQRVACEVWYHRNARSNQKNHVAMADACSRAGRRVQVRRSARACGRVQGRMGDLEDCARAKAGMDMRPAGGCGGRRGGRVRRSAGAGGCERTSNHGRSNRCEHSSRFGMRAAAAKRQPSRINARASRPRPPRAGPRPTGRARRARRT